MGQHVRGKLGPAARRELVRLMVEEGFSERAAAAAFSVARKTAHHWKVRWREAGEQERASGRWALDRSSRPRRSPNRSDEATERRVCETRRRTGWGPRLIAGETGVSHSTVHAILRRHGCSRAPRPERGEVVRYEWPCPGDLLHMDVKRSPRFRRPGHAATGDRRASRMQRANPLGHDYFHAIIDDHSRLVYGELLADEKATTVTAFTERALAWFAAQGIEALDHQHREAHVIEPPAHQRLQVLARPGDELARDRRLRDRGRLGLNRLAHGLPGPGQAAGRDAGPHPLEHDPRERIAVGEVLVGREPRLLAAVGRAHARALHRDAAAAERDLASLATVTDGDAIRVVLAPRSDDVIDLLAHQLVQDAEPDTDRERQQPLLRSSRQLAERNLHPLGQLRRVRAGRRGPDLINQYLLHGGSSCLGWNSSAQHAPNRSGRGGSTAASSSTDYGTTSSLAGTAARC
jgi:transposase